MQLILVSQGVHQGNRCRDTYVRRVIVHQIGAAQDTCASEKACSLRRGCHSISRAAACTVKPTVSTIKAREASSAKDTCDKAAYS